MYSFGYILGVLLTDGSAFFTQWHDRRRRNPIVVEGIIALQCKDEEFAKRFAKCLSEFLNRKVAVHTFTRNNFRKSTLKGAKTGYTFNGFFVRVKARRYIQSFRDETAKVLNSELEYTEETLLGILDAIVDAEGYWNGAYLDITQKDIGWIEYILNKMGVKYAIYRSPSQRAHHIRVMSKVVRSCRINSYKVH